MFFQTLKTAYYLLKKLISNPKHHLKMINHTNQVYKLMKLMKQSCHFTLVQCQKHFDIQTMTTNKVVIILGKKSLIYYQMFRRKDIANKSFTFSIQSSCKCSWNLSSLFKDKIIHFWPGQSLKFIFVTATNRNFHVLCVFYENIHDLVVYVETT